MENETIDLTINLSEDVHNHVKISFVTNNEIGIEFEYNTPETIAFVASLPYLKFNETFRMWTCHYYFYESLEENVKALRSLVVPEPFHIEADPIPFFVMKIFQMPEKPIVRFPLEDHIEPSLVKLLKDYQKEGVYFGVSKGGRLLIADEMGLGKTHQAIALADYYKSDWPLLIATTAGMRETWISHLKNLLPEIDPLDIVSFESTSQEISSTTKIVVTSYSLLRFFADRTLKHHFGAIILDESQNVKNYKANQTKAAKKLCHLAKRAILLSGTPALSRPNELYTQLQMIDPKFTSFKRYSMRYCDAFEGEYGWECRGASFLHELCLLLKKRFMIRRTKEDHLEGLTNKIRERIFIKPELTQEQKIRLGQHALRLRRDKKRQKNLIKDDNFFTYYVDTAIAKVDAVSDYLVFFVTNTKDKFIIFAHHRVMMDAIQNTLVAMKIQHIRIDGSTKPHERETLMHRFQTDHDYQGAVLSITACNSGLNLTAAKQVIFAELTYTPEVIKQAEDRAHRIGQTDDVKIKFLHAEKTIDDDLWSMMIEKQAVLKEIDLDNDDLNSNFYASNVIRDENQETDSDDGIVKDINSPFKKQRISSDSEEEIRELEKKICTPRKRIRRLVSSDEEDYP